LNNDTATRETVDSKHWLHTGDTGYFDKDGYLILDGRKKDIIKYCNYQISPAEVAETLEQIDGVETAFVTGIADIDKGDLPTALCVKIKGATATEEEVLTQYNASSPDYKLLRGGLYFVEQLPMTISGKVAIVEAKQIATKLYNERRGVVTIVSNGNEVE
jgi:4-coumarate--CoA ligase